jgi:hypothetical protein
MAKLIKKKHGKLTTIKQVGQLNYLSDQWV